MLYVAERITPITVAIIVTKANRSPNVTYIDITSDSFDREPEEEIILLISPPFLFKEKEPKRRLYIHLKMPAALPARFILA